MGKHLTGYIAKRPDDELIVELIRKYLNEPKLLIDGRKDANFPLLPREILVNWILCIPLFHFANHKCYITAPVEENGTDGGVFDKTADLQHNFQHVYLPKFEASEVIDNEINRQIYDKFLLKANRGKEYSDGTELIIFSDARGSIQPDTINKLIAGRHYFKSVYAVGLENIDSYGYHYWLTVLDSPNKYFTFQIIVPNDCNFLSCRVTQAY